MFWQPEGGWIPIHRQLFIFGLRFPLLPFVLELLHTTSLSLNQLSPNSFIHLNSFTAFCSSIGTAPAIDFFFQFFSITSSREKGFFQIIKNPGRETLMDTPSSNKGWHGDWFYIKGPDTEMVGPWTNPNKDQLNPNRITKARSEAFEALYARRPSVKWSRDLLNNQEWLHSVGLANQGKSPHNEAILEAAGVARPKLSAADKLRGARASKTVGATKAGHPAVVRSEAPKQHKKKEASGSSKLKLADEEKPRKVVAAEKPTERSEGKAAHPSPAAPPLNPEVTVVQSSPEDTESISVVLSKRKRKEGEDLPASPAKRPRTTGENSVASAPRAHSAPLDQTKSGADLFEKLLATRAEETNMLLQLAADRRALEKQLKEASSRCSDAEREREKIRAQIKTQHEGFNLMKRDYEASRKVKVELEQEIDNLKRELDLAQRKQSRSDELVVSLREKKSKAELLVAELGKKVESEEVKRKIMGEDFEAERSRLLKLLEESERIIKLHSEQMKHLKDNLEVVVDGWTAREADWLKGPVNPTSPSVVAPDLRRKIIEEYKASAEYETDFNNAVCNEFAEGFEHARQLVRNNGQDPDALGIVFPDD